MTIRADSSATARSLSGTVLDASGAPMPRVLVERMDKTFKQRLDATTTDERGQFSLKRRGRGMYYLRFRYRAFNDYELPVLLAPDAIHKTLAIEMNVSN